jgi:hypothetical protein
MPAGLAWLLVARAAGGHWLAAVLAILSAAATILCLARGVQLIWRPPAYLVFDREGIVITTPLARRQVLWTDLKGARLYERPVNSGALFSIRVKVIALDLADPRAFYEREDGGKRPWMGYDSGWRSDFISFPYSMLDRDEASLMYLVTEGIARNGRAA